jgi:hypothetical protein
MLTRRHTQTHADTRPHANAGTYLVNSHSASLDSIEECYTLSFVHSKNIAGLEVVPANTRAIGVKVSAAAVVAESSTSQVPPPPTHTHTQTTTTYRLETPNVQL